MVAEVGAGQRPGVAALKATSFSCNGFDLARLFGACFGWRRQDCCLRLHPFPSWLLMALLVVPASSAWFCQDRDVVWAVTFPGVKLLLPVSCSRLQGEGCSSASVLLPPSLLPGQSPKRICGCHPCPHPTSLLVPMGPPSDVLTRASSRHACLLNEGSFIE